MYFEWAASLSGQDRADIVDILNAVAAREGTNGIPQPLTGEEGAKLTAYLDDAIRKQHCHQLLMRHERGGGIIGIATLERSKIPARFHVVEIKRVAIAPERRAAARMFLIEGWVRILDRCRELKCDLIHIDVSEDGPYRMWERLGFETYARIPDYARVGPRKLDGYFMYLYVDRAYDLIARYRRAGSFA